MLDVCLFGGASFWVDGTMVRSDMGRAGRLLACYLFEFIGRSHRREQLADLFWGELDRDKARSALNTALWRIRKMLDCAQKGGAHRLVTIGEGALIEPAAFIRVDTHAFQDALGRRVAQMSDTDLWDAEEERISAAIECYGGPFLDGEDQDWILQHREHLYCLFIRSCLHLMRTAARRREYDRALYYGRRILATDPLREGVQRDVMLLLVLNGQRANAICAYKRLEALLRSELSIDPMPDTKCLYSRLMSGEVFSSLESYSTAHFGASLHA